ASGATVVAGWEIDHFPLRGLVRPAIHARTPFAIVDAVTSLIQEDDGHRRPRPQNLAQPLVLEPSCATQTRVVRVAAVEPTEHGNAPLPGEALACAWSRCRSTGVFIVARTPPDAGVVRAVRPEQTFLNHQIDVPVDRKSTRLNSSHDQISYAVFCLKKKKKKNKQT